MCKQLGINNKPVPTRAFFPTAFRDRITVISCQGHNDAASL